MDASSKQPVSINSRSINQLWMMLVSTCHHHIKININITRWNSEQDPGSIHSKITIPSRAIWLIARKMGTILATPSAVIYDQHFKGSNLRPTFQGQQSITSNPRAALQGQQFMINSRAAIHDQQFKSNNFLDQQSKFKDHNLRHHFKGNNLTHFKVSKPLSSLQGHQSMKWVEGQQTIKGSNLSQFWSTDYAPSFQKQQQNKSCWSDDDLSLKTKWGRWGTKPMTTKLIWITPFTDKLSVLLYWIINVLHTDNNKTHILKSSPFSSISCSIDKFSHIYINS